MSNVLSTAKRVSIISALVEGVSVRATARMFDVSKAARVAPGPGDMMACRGAAAGRRLGLSVPRPGAGPGPTLDHLNLPLLVHALR